MQSAPSSPEVALQSFANEVPALAREMRLPADAHYGPVDAIGMIFNQTKNAYERQPDPHHIGITGFTVTDALLNTYNSVRIEHVASLLSATPDEWNKVRTRFIARDYPKKADELAAMDQFEASVNGLTKAERRPLMANVITKEAAEIQMKIHTWTIAQVEGTPDNRLPDVKFREAIGE